MSPFPSLELTISLLALLLLPQLQSATRQLAPPPDPPPNVLLIVADDVGVDMLGCYAQSYPSLALEPCTPILDSLAAAGVRFTNAWSNPSCSPTRAQIMTGKRSRHTGVGTISNKGTSIPDMHGLQIGEDTLATLLGGHQRVALGKWHLSDPNQDGALSTHPLQLGFEAFAGTLYGVEPHYDDWPKLILPEGIQLPGYSKYATTDLTDDALVELGTLQEPWLLYVSHYAIHSPFHCPEAHGFSTLHCSTWSCAQAWCEDCVGLLSSPACVSLGSLACQARAMAQTLDSKVGELLHQIDLADTLVVFVGDNGTPSLVTVPPFDPGHAKWTVYQGGINVPLIVAGAGVTPGIRHELVSATDLFATLAEVAGVGMPPDPNRDSVSLGQYLWPGGGGAPRPHVYSEHFEPNFVPDAWGDPPPGYQAVFHHRAVRNASYKLIDLRDWDAVAGACLQTVELYHLADAPPQDPAFGPDPFEADDLMPSQASWSPEVQAAFDELSFLLEVLYPPLPTGCP